MNDEFVAVGLTRAESTSSHVVMKVIQDAAQKAFGLQPGPKILMCDDLDQPTGVIPGFADYSIVFFLNRTAWAACEATGVTLKQSGTIPKSGIPGNYILLVGDASDAPQKF
jgi:hypothetical protein